MFLARDFLSLQNLIIRLFTSCAAGVVQRPRLEEFLTILQLHRRHLNPCNGHGWFGSEITRQGYLSFVDRPLPYFDLSGVRRVLLCLVRDCLGASVGRKQLRMQLLLPRVLGGCVAAVDNSVRGGASALPGQWKGLFGAGPWVPTRRRILWHGGRRRVERAKSRHCSQMF